MASHPANKEWAVLLFVGVSFLPLIFFSIFYKEVIKSLAVFSKTAEHALIATLDVNSASGYEPPPDIGKPRRTGGSGGRVS